MWILITRLGAWLVGRVFPLAVMVVFVLLGVALYLFVQENVRVELDRTDLMVRLEEERAELAALREQIVEALNALEEESRRVRHRMETAERMMANIRRFQSFWDRFFTSQEVRNKEEERLRYAESVKAETQEQLFDLEEQIGDLQMEQSRVASRVVRIDRDLTDLESSGSKLVYYFSRSWEAVRIPLAAGFAVFLVGPTFWKLFAFYVAAPVLSAGKPVRLVDASDSLPAGPSRVSQRIELRKGETAVIKERFLQASDDALSRKTRFVFDWRIPFSSLACGLVELIEMHNPGDERLGITFSTQAEPTTELAIVELALGRSLVLRPSYLAGVVYPEGSDVVIRRHWRIFSLHAWITLQFRYFEFVGPCRLVVCGNRGVRAETLEALENGDSKSRRTNQDSTIGFTPGLDYHSVRAETFWSYYRGMNPLFDDLFTGSGTFLCQEISFRSRKGRFGRFWEQVWNGFLKIFGL